MDRIAVAGTSLQDTDVSGLGRLRRPAPGEENAFLRELSDELGASELVLLATCNRLEVIYAREEGERPEAADLRVLAGFLGDVDHPLTLRTGREAIRHVFRVACSLDSLVLGEDQIIAQVRAAYARSADIGLVGGLLGPLFHNALAIGKKVRSETELARHPVSVVSLAVQRLREVGDDPLPVVAVVGAGEMGALLVRTLNDAGRPPAYVANRSLEKAQALAQTVGAGGLTLMGLRAGDAPVDVVITATASPHELFDVDDLRRLASRAPSGRGLLGIDLSVPRNLPPVGSNEAQVQVVDLDALRQAADDNRALRAEAAVDAEQLVERKLETHVRRFREEVAAPVVTQLRQEAEEILQRELNGLFGGRLAHLEALDRRAIERWARATFGRLMHPSVNAVKRMAQDLLPLDLDQDRNGEDPR